MKPKRISRKAAAEAVRIDRRRLINESTPFAVKEAYVKLRTNLMFCMTADGERPCKTFAITSSKPSEGKSLTAANIAISCAMLGKRTLLVDADLRKPTQRRLWRTSDESGLCDLLARIQPLKLNKVEDLSLWIACTGTIPPNPSELLASEKMREFIEYAERKYDYVIIDTPPINTVADAQIIAAQVDGVILVAKSGTTSSVELSAAIDAVHTAGGNLSGVVMNDINMKSVKYAYRYKADKYGYRRDYAESYETE